MYTSLTYHSVANGCMITMVVLLKKIQLTLMTPHIPVLSLIQAIPMIAVVVLLKKIQLILILPMARYAN